MVSEHGWDYNMSSGPPESWDHGKDAQSYYYVIGWLKYIHSSDTTLGVAELEAGVRYGAPATTATTVAAAATGWDVEPVDVLAAPVNEAFEIIGHEEEVKPAKKTPSAWDVKLVLGTGDGWLAEDTTPGVVVDGRIWRGVKRFRVPVLGEITISDDPSVAKSRWVEPARGGYRGQRPGGGGYRGRGKGKGRGNYQGNWAGVSDWSKGPGVGGSNRGTRGVATGDMW